MKSANVSIPQRVSVPVISKPGCVKLSLKHRKISHTKWDCPGNS